MNGTAQDIGREAEEFVMRSLRVRGLSVKRMAYNSPFDLLVGDKRVEVKASRPTSDKGGARWVINIHRHGVLDESKIDVYVILLDLSIYGKKKPLVLIIPSPVESKTLNYSLDSLLTIHHWQIENWAAFGVTGKNKYRSDNSEDVYIS